MDLPHSEVTRPPENLRLEVERTKWMVIKIYVSCAMLLALGGWLIRRGFFAVDRFPHHHVSFRLSLFESEGGQLFIGLLGVFTTAFVLWMVVGHTRGILRRIPFLVIRPAGIAVQSVNKGELVPWEQVKDIGFTWVKMPSRVQKPRLNLEIHFTAPVLYDFNSLKKVDRVSVPMVGLKQPIKLINDAIVVFRRAGKDGAMLLGGRLIP